VATGLAATLLSEIAHDLGFSLLSNQHTAPDFFLPRAHTTHSYNEAGRLEQVLSPDPDGVGPQGAPLTTYTYDLNGNLASTTDPNGNATPTAGNGKTTTPMTGRTG